MSLFKLILLQYIADKKRNFNTHPFKSKCAFSHGVRIRQRRSLFRHTDRTHPDNGGRCSPHQGMHATSTPAKGMKCLSAITRRNTKWESRINRGGNTGENEGGPGALGHSQRHQKPADKKTNDYIRNTVLIYRRTLPAPAGDHREYDSRPYHLGPRDRHRETENQCADIRERPPGRTFH